MFDDLLNELTTNIYEHGGKKCIVPNEFCECVSEKGKCKLNSWLWDVPGFRRWRVTRLDAGDRLQVLNSVAYPDFKADTPIMGIDLLWFEKKQKLVAILDFQPLVQDQNYFDKYFDGLKKLKNQFFNFHNQKNMFIYDSNQYFSPWVLFCRGSIHEAQDLLPNIFSPFLNCYWDLEKISYNNNFNISEYQVEKLQINYDKYSADKDPAHGLFSGFFGKEWSDRFLKEFLFPLC